MNVFFKINGKIVTPPLHGTILAGVTRSSCIQMLKSWGMEVEERPIDIDELFASARSGLLRKPLAPEPQPLFLL
jgi:branched-chain amino acid aminotransferase